MSGAHEHDCTHDLPDHGGMSCQEVVDLLIDFIERDLSDRREQLVDKHLHDCPHCYEFVEQYRKTSVICREELARRMPADLERRLIAALREQVDGD